MRAQTENLLIRRDVNGDVVAARSERRLVGYRLHAPHFDFVDPCRLADVEPAGHELRHMVMRDGVDPLKRAVRRRRRVRYAGGIGHARLRGGAEHQRNDRQKAMHEDWPHDS